MERKRAGRKNGCGARTREEGGVDVRGEDARGTAHPRWTVDGRSDKSCSHVTWLNPMA
jgi:hypothetical protein